MSKFEEFVRCFLVGVFLSLCLFAIRIVIDLVSIEPADFNTQSYAEFDRIHCVDLTAGADLVQPSGSTNASNSVIVNEFRDYVSEYSTLCNTAEQITLNSEHYVIQDDSHVTVSSDVLNISGNRGYICNTKSDYTVELYYDEDNSKYCVDLYNKDGKDCGWSNLSINNLEDELYLFVKKQFNTKNDLQLLENILQNLELDNAYGANCSDCYLISTKADYKLLELLQPAYMSSGIIKDSYVHVYFMQSVFVFKVFYVYENSDVEQEAYTFKFNITPNSLEELTPPVCDCDLSDLSDFYHKNIRR